MFKNNYYIFRKRKISRSFKSNTSQSFNKRLEVIIKMITDADFKYWCFVRFNCSSVFPNNNCDYLGITQKNLLTIIFNLSHRLSLHYYGVTKHKVLFDTITSVLFEKTGDHSPFIWIKHIIISFHLKVFWNITIDRIYLATVCVFSSNFGWSIDILCDHEWNIFADSSLPNTYWIVFTSLWMFLWMFVVKFVLFMI